MSRTLLAFVPALLLVGCVSTPTETYYKGKLVPVVSGVSMSCKKPYVLTQDCSGLSGAALKIQVDGVTFKVGATADGRVVMVATDKFSPKAHEVEQVGDLARKTAEATGAVMQKVEVILAGEVLFGYVFSYDRDVYTALRAKAPAK